MHAIPVCTKHPVWLHWAGGALARCTELCLSAILITANRRQGFTTQVPHRLCSELPYLQCPLSCNDDDTQHCTTLHATCAPAAICEISHTIACASQSTSAPLHTPWHSARLSHYHKPAKRPRPRCPAFQPCACMVLRVNSIHLPLHTHRSSPAHRNSRVLDTTHHRSLSICGPSRQDLPVCR